MRTIGEKGNGVYVCDLKVRTSGMLGEEDWSFKMSSQCKVKESFCKLIAVDLGVKFLGFIST